MRKRQTTDRKIGKGHPRHFTEEEKGMAYKLGEGAQSRY